MLVRPSVEVDLDRVLACQVDELVDWVTAGHYRAGGVGMSDAILAAITRIVARIRAART